MDFVHLAQGIREGLGEEGRHVGEEETARLLTNKLVFPESCYEYETYIGNFAARRGRTFGFNCEISMPVEQSQALAREIFEATKATRFKKGSAKTGFDLRWNPEDFIREEDFYRSTDPDFYEYDFKMRIREVDSKIPRTSMDAGRNVVTHAVNLTDLFSLYRGTRRLSIKGAYRQFTGEILELFEPTKAKITLTKEDADRLVRARSTSPILGGPIAKTLERVLNWERKRQNSNMPRFGFRLEGNRTSSYSPDGGENVTISVSPEYVQTIEDQIGKSVEKYWIKKYGRRDRGHILSDLQRFVKGVSEIELPGITLDHPTLTHRQAREATDEEVGMLEYSFKQEWPDTVFGPCRRIVLGRLASEVLGAEIANFDDGYAAHSEEERVPTREYVSFLKSNGYQPNDDIGYDHELGLDFHLNERHLLEFLMQAHKKDPSILIERCRASYTNTRTQEVTAEVTAHDASVLRRTELPKLAEFRNFYVFSDSIEDSVNIYSNHGTRKANPFLVPLHGGLMRERNTEDHLALIVKKDLDCSSGNFSHLLNIACEGAGIKLV